MKEIWKDVKGFEGYYMVSNLGNVKSINYGRYYGERNIKQRKHKTGYVFVSLCHDGKMLNKLVHRLVAESFMTNTDQKPCVNHIDGNKENNVVTNLEWVTRSENTLHAIDHGLRAASNMQGRTGIKNPLSKPVFQYSRDNTLIKRWDCISDAARYYDCRPCTIINCVKGRIKSCKGYIWREAES